MKKSTAAWAAGLGVLGCLGMICVAAALVYFGARGISSRAPTDAEKRLVLDAAALEPYGAQPDAKCGTYRAKRHLDASLEIEYEHDCEGADLYVVSGAEIARSTRDARQSYPLAIGAYRTGMLFGENIKLQPRADLLTIGDQHYAALVTKDGKPIGNVFVVRQGRVVHSLLLIGLYFDDRETVEELMGRVVEEAKRQ